MPRRKPIDFLVSKSVRLPNSLAVRLAIQVEKGGFTTETKLIQYCLETGLSRLEDNQKENEIEPS